MVFALMNLRTTYHKNGIWWFTKIGAKIVGESRWDALRLHRRVLGAKIWYARQQMIYEMFLEAPDLSNTIGIYPKADVSHGFPMYQTYEAYRDLQENTINSDGWFGMWFVVLAGFYLIHFYYSYIAPFYWLRHPELNDQETRNRMRDAIATTVLEESFGLKYAEWAWGPHDFHYQRIRGVTGYAHPDDPRAMAYSTFNRKHKYREHYIDDAATRTHMTGMASIFYE